MISKFKNKLKDFSTFDIQRLGEILVGVDDCYDGTVEFGGNPENQLLLISKDHQTEIGLLGIDISFGENEIIFYNPLNGELLNLNDKQRTDLESFLSTELEIQDHEKNDIINNLDSDNNGILDIIETQKDFFELLKNKQSTIIKIDRNYIHQFIKISNYLVSKSNTLQSVFERIKSEENKRELDHLLSELEDLTNNYNLLLLHSVNMVVSLTTDDMITFYSIYEAFDKTTIFQSNWEKEIGNKLEGIEKGIENVMKSIGKLENNLIQEISNLSYITEQSFNELQNSVIGELSGIHSSINFNNLLTGIQTYQTYRINNNTKSLR